MAGKYLKYFYQVCGATYILLLHLFSFIYDITNVSQALIHLDTSFFEIFFHEFLSVMVITFLTTAAIHLPLKLWLSKRQEQDFQQNQRNQDKKIISELVSQPKIPRELLGEISLN